MTSVGTIINALDDYVIAGISIIPLNGTKPVSGKISNLDYDSSILNKANAIGAICGEASGNLECIFFKAGKNAKLFDEFISNPDVRFIIKRSNAYAQLSACGYYLVYRYEKESYFPDFAPILQSGRCVWGEGMYFIIYPSIGCYKVFGSPDDIGTIGREERDFLIHFHRQIKRERRMG